MAAFGGCLANTGSPDRVEPPAPDAQVGVLSALNHVCPPNGRTLQHGLCVADLTHPDKSLFEPYLTIHPTNNEIWVVMAHGGMFITKDAGKEWTRIEVGWGYADPVVEFDDTGRLHISGMGLGGIFWSSSDDLGIHWAKPVELTRGGDRDWMTVGPDGKEIYISWQEYSGGRGPAESVIAWSLDAGATWTTLPKEQRPACPNAGRPFVLASGPIFGCNIVKWRYNESRPLSNVAPWWYESVILEAFEGRFYQLNTTTATVSEWAQLPDWRGYMPHLMRAPDGSLVAWMLAWVGGSDPRTNQLIVSRSTDEGKTWPQRADLRRIASIDDQWKGAPFIGWGTIDPWGVLHVMIYDRDNYNRPVRNSPFQEGPFTPYQPVISPSIVAHLQLNPRTFELLDEQLLTSPSEVDNLGPTPSKGGRSSGGDHYYGLAFGDAYGVALWTRHSPADAGLQYTIVEQSQRSN